MRKTARAILAGLAATVAPVALAAGLTTASAAPAARTPARSVTSLNMARIGHGPLYARYASGNVPCVGPYQPAIPSGGYLRVTANGHGVRSDAARSNYQCRAGQLAATAPVK